MIRVLICDDQSVVCEGLRAILSTSPDIQVIQVVYDGSQALEAVKRVQPDLVLMDLKMPVMNGVQATREILEISSNTRILVLTTYDFDEWVYDAIRAGASGYLLKDTPHDELIDAIKGTVAGKTYVDPLIAGKLFSLINRNDQPVDATIFAKLSEREKEVLELIAQGMNNTDIAHQLFLSEGTVRNYVSTILTKLDVSDRTQAAVMALRAGLLHRAK